MLSPKQKRLLFKVLPYPVLFLIAGLMYGNIEYGLLEGSEKYPESDAEYDPLNSLVAMMSMNLLLGLVLGVIEEMVFKNRFKRMAFTLKIVLKTLLYTIIFMSVLMLGTVLLAALNAGQSLTDSGVFESVMEFFLSYGVISIVIYAGSIIGLSLFFSEIVDYLGLDIVSNFFSGKYSKPVEENRIFMFLDMKDSTTIAEKIGHKKHYQLINDYYGEMTDAIVRTRGSIYQYVGDEIVVSWKLEQGLADSNCLRCFFQIRQSIANKADYFHRKYDVVPTFKAGLHFGEVTRGQVGQIKRDLLYTGDVLNATARIQGLCNQVGERLLISAALKDALPANAFQFTPKGEYELRGRQKKEEIFAVAER